MKEFSKYVGLDVHKETIAVSVAEANGGEVRYIGEIANTPEAVDKLVKQLRKGGANLSFCYEAGPCGYGIHPQLTDLGWDCQVVAPSLIPKKAGARIKTDRRDSLMLARLHRAGELTAVWVPDGAQEALRDLTRAREDMKHLQRQAKQRLLAFLLRHGKRYNGKSNWTLVHYRWMEEVKFNHPVQQIVFQEYIDTVKAMSKRVEALDKQIESAAGESVFWPVIEGLMALRGVNLLTATTIVAEIGDLRRFASAPQLMAYLGVVPSEHSSGGTKSRGGITKTGNGHVRRVLVEAAWTYRHPARKTAILQRRAKRTSEAVQEIAWKAQTRLCGRYRLFEARGKL
ncbi:MAG: IS110 family transposase, partial [Burkholderiales bacterium]